MFMSAITNFGDDDMHDFDVKEIYPNVFQLSDYRSLHVILINGKDKSILWDMGFGVYDLKSELKKLTDNEIMVFGSHGHLDHTLGCMQFDEVYVNKRDHKLFYKQNGFLIRKKVGQNLMKHNIYNRKQAFEYRHPKLPKLNDLPVGATYDLGGLTAEIVDLSGHTAGSVGLLIKEYRLLLTGDAICNDLWIYLKESFSAKYCLETLKRTLDLPFDNYVCAHKSMIFPKKQINNIIDVMEHLDPNTNNTRVLFRTTEVYECTKDTEYGTISILYDESKL